MIQRKIIYLLFTAFLIFSPFIANVSKAEQRVIERLYVSTNRGAYIAGEVIWLSVYCFDISRNSDVLSDLSNVAYIEIHNSDGVLITAKIALDGGRGSGRVELPPTMPTGNYILIGYTKQMLNEEKAVCFERVISIYNTLSNERVNGNVEVVDAKSLHQSKDSIPVKIFISPSREIITFNIGEPGKTITADSSFPIIVNNNSTESVTLNVSVVKVDSIPSPSGPLLPDYLAQFKGKADKVVFTNKYTPEYEGEIIKGKISYKGSDILTEKVAFLSAANGMSDIYTSTIDSSGNITFYTNSIFGNRDIVLEVPTVDSNSMLSFEILDPFLKTAIKNIPKLILDKRIEESLNERSIDMQIEKRFRTDTLYEKIQVNRDPLFRVKPTVYMLDDYTRFPVMQDVVVEFITELRFRKVDGITDLQVRWENAFRALTYSRENTLVLIDGIPVFNHKRVFDYDPLKVKSISIYGSEFSLGFASFSGIVSLKTYKGDYPGLTFDKNVRIMDFIGVQYPSRFTAKELKNKSYLPDVRTTLYWDPNITLATGDSKKLECFTSDKPGTYEVIVEGVSKDGSAFFNRTKFVVK